MLAYPPPNAVPDEFIVVNSLLLALFHFAFERPVFLLLQVILELDYLLIDYDIAFKKYLVARNGYCYIIFILCSAKSLILMSVEATMTMVPLISSFAQTPAQWTLLKAPNAFVPACLKTVLVIV